MRLRAAWTSAKVHRFELFSAMLLGAAATVWGSWLWYRLVALNVPFRCIDGWLIDGPATRPDCIAQMQQWGGIAGAEAEPFFAVMAIVPFLIGLIGGTPIVAREVEAGTSQTAWWLNPSRLEWLARQVAAIGVPLLIVVGLAGFASSLMATQDAAWGVPAFQRIGLHGPLVVARAAAAFGLALLVGSALGRTLPAFIAAGAVIAALAIGVSIGRGVWLHDLEPSVVGVSSPLTGEVVVERGALATGWGWRAPDGTISLQEVEGYEPVLLGVAQSSAMAWAPIEMAIYLPIGPVALLAAAAIVRRRRPI